MYNYFDERNLNNSKSTIFSEQRLNALNKLENESKQWHKEMVISWIKDIYLKSKAQMYSDFKIHINQRVFNTHRVILRCFVPIIFKKISQSIGKNQSLSEVKEVHVVGIDDKAFDILLRYMYCGELETPNENNFHLVHQNSLRLKMFEFCHKWTQFYERRKELRM